MVVYWKMNDQLDQRDLDRILAHVPLAVDGRYQTKLEAKAGVLFLRMSGTLLQPIPDEFVARIQDLFRRNPAQRAVVDLSRCQFISSAAIGALVEFFNASSARGGQVLLLQPPDKIMKLIDLLGLTRMFLVVEDDTMAITYFDAQGRLGE